MLIQSLQKEIEQLRSQIVQVEARLIVKKNYDKGCYDQESNCGDMGLDC